MATTPGRLECIWNNYTNCKPNSEEKKLWLDVYLAEFLSEFKKSHSVSTYVCTSVPDILVKEFMSEVHNACSQIDVTDELTPIKNYILRGRGWRFLAVLQQISVLKLSNVYELSHLLISLYALVDYEECFFDDAEKGKYTRNSFIYDCKTSNIDAIINNKLNLVKRRSKSFQRSTESEKIVKTNDTNKLPRPETLVGHWTTETVKLLPFPRFIFSNIGGDSLATENCTSNGSVISDNGRSNVFTLGTLMKDPSIVGVLQCDGISNYEFRLLVLQNILNLCEAEFTHTDEYDQLIGGVIKFCVENLCALQYRFSKKVDNCCAPDENTAVVGESPDDTDTKLLHRVEKFNNILTQILIACADGAKRCKKLVDFLTQNGIVQIYLQLLQEVQSSCNGAPSTAAASNLLCHLCHCILWLFFQILRQEGIVQRLNTFNHLYRQLIGRTNGRLFENAIKTLIACGDQRRERAINRATTIVTFLGLLVVRFKVLKKRISRIEEGGGLRSPISATAPTTVLTNLDVAACGVAGGADQLSSHHDNIFGRPFKAHILSATASLENCCISSSVVCLLRIALEIDDVELTCVVLRTLTFCGSCCCVPYRWFLPKLLKSVVVTLPVEPVDDDRNRLTHLKRRLLFAFLQRRFYRDVGMYRGECCVLCVLSNKCEENGVVVDRCSRHDQWECVLSEYRNLLLHEDRSIVRSTGCHILRTFGGLTKNIQRYLVEHVLKFAIQNYCRPNDDNAVENRCADTKADYMITCLALLADYTVHKAFAHDLDTILNVNTIRHLLPEAMFSDLCCRILETRIIYKTAQIEDASAVSTCHTFMPVLTDSCTAELNVLLYAFNEYYEVAVTHPESTQLERRQSPNTFTETITCLKTVTSTLERLVVRSTVIESFLRTHPLKEKFKELLFLVLRIMSSSSPEQYDKQLSLVDDELRLKLTQPLMIICMRLFTDSIENQIKLLIEEALQAGKISIKNIFDSLLQRNSGGIDGGGPVNNGDRSNWNNAAAFAGIYFAEVADTDGEDEIACWSNIDASISDISLATEDENNEGEVCAIQNCENGSGTDGNQLLMLLESYSRSSLLYPMVCNIAIDLINALQVDRCTEDALYVLQHISAICARNSDICAQLTEQNMVSRLLDKLEQSLGEELLSPEEADVQYAIAQFLSVLLCHRCEPNHLRRLLAFLKRPTPSAPPYDHLVGTLAAVVDKSTRHDAVQPSFYLQYPCPADHDRHVDFDEPAEALAITMRDLQKHSTVISPWLVSALTLPLNTNLDWCIWLTGFSTSFWLRYSDDDGVIETRSDYFDPKRMDLDGEDNDNGYSNNGCGDDESGHNLTENAIHVISVGYDSMLLETWLEERTGCLSVRLTRPEGNSFEILSQIKFSACRLEKGRWHHVVLNVKDTMRQQKIALEIACVLDGLHEQTKYLVFMGIFVRKVKPACIMIGDTRMRLAAGATYRFANLMMFRAAILSKECCLTIRAFGPDLENVISCTANALSPNFSALLRSNVHNQNILRDFSISSLKRAYSDNMKLMQDNILITYTSREVDYFFHYTNTDQITSTSGFSLSSSSSSASSSAFPSTTLFRRTKTASGNNVRHQQRVPRPVKVIQFSHLIRTQRQSFFDCVQNLGGFSFLAFLFAKLVDVCQSERTQCSALKLVLKSCVSAANDTQLYSQFCRSDGYRLLASVVVSDRSRMTRAAFIELTNTLVCSGNKSGGCGGRYQNYFMIGYDNEATSYYSENAIICNAEILTHMLLPNWRYWDKYGVNDVYDNDTADEGYLLTKLFKGLSALCSTANSYRHVNIESLVEVQVVDRTLDMCKEKFILNDDSLSSTNTNRDLCTAILEFVKTMIGSPPSTVHIKSIVHYLYVVHPAANLYCAHNPSTFYFLFNNLSQQCSAVTSSPANDRTDGEDDEVTVTENPLLMEDYDDYDEPNYTNFHSLSSISVHHSSTPCTRVAATENISQNITTTTTHKQINVLTPPTSLSVADSGVTSDVTPSEQTTPCHSNKDGSEFASEDGDNQRNYEESRNAATMKRQKPHPEERMMENVNSTNAGCGELFDDGESNILRRMENNYGNCEQYVIVIGLLDIVHDTLMMTSSNDAMMSAPAAGVNSSSSKQRKDGEKDGADGDQVIDVKLLLVLANHPNVCVRSSVVRAVLAWLLRFGSGSDDAANSSFYFASTVKGFFQLANQLATAAASSPTTHELVNGCISLIARCRWDAIDQLSEMEEDITLPALHFQALPPLLAVFPATVHNVSLCRNVTHFFRVLIQRVPHGLKKLVEHGLVESVVKIMINLIHSPATHRTTHTDADFNAARTPEDVTSGGNYIDLLNDVIDLFTVIVETCVKTPGVLYPQMLNEIVYKCRYWEVTEEALCGLEKRCVRIIHNLYCSLLKTGLDTVLDLIKVHHSRDTTLKRSQSPSLLNSVTGSLSGSLSSIPSSIKSFTDSSSKQKLLPRSEMIERYKLIINRSTEYLQFSATSVVTEEDIDFACHLFDTLITGIVNIIEYKPYIRIGSFGSTIYWAARETLKTQASNLFIWMLMPDRPVNVRVHTLKRLLDEAKTKDIISNLIYNNLETEQRFALFLWHLMYSKNCKLTLDQYELCEDFKKHLEKWAIVSPQSVGQADDRWQYEVASANKELSVIYWSLEKAQQSAVYKCVYKMEKLSKKISECAKSITEAVAKRQGQEQMLMLNRMRNNHRYVVQTRNTWRQVVKQMTHEWAPWPHIYLYPETWELDFTEGPDRVRKRLKRSRLGIKKRFFKHDTIASQYCDEDYQYPLAYLLTNNDVRNLYPSVPDYLSMDDTITFMCSVINVQPDCEVQGEILIGRTQIYFIAARVGNDNATIDETEKYSFAAYFKDIVEVQNRRYQLKEKAIEFFFNNGRTYLFAFDTTLNRDKFLKYLIDERKLPNRVFNDVTLGDISNKWREGELTNWQYLKSLNKMAGRSYNDLMQYPVMPFILAEYENDCINLEDASIYRNLRKPMAIQDKRNEAYFIRHYEDMKSELMCSFQNSLSSKPPAHHYGSHYSNSGSILHFLVRLPPFTQMFLQYQDNNFDQPDRTFHSLDTTWKLTSAESLTDVKELIPEFFYLPEFLINQVGFNFGIRQNGEPVDHVKLPEWTHGDARLFILIHRQMLESEYVKENLPHWIDLIYGFKQTGKEAVEAINLFHPATYFGFDIDAIPDELEREAWTTMVKTYGQTPRQLFRQPHPMIAQTLIPETDNCIPVIKGIKGIKWGNYAGSPSKPPPSIVWNRFHSIVVYSLVPVFTSDGVFGLPKCASLLLSYSNEGTTNLVNEGGVTLSGCALLSWGHADGIIRTKERKEQPPIPAIFCPPKDTISVCSTAPDCPLIWIGFVSGNILVFKFTFNADNNSVEIEREPTTLVGHHAKVNNICISKAYGIAVSTSDDGNSIIWDLNEIIYVNSIPSEQLPTSLVAVSDTLGDIATVCNYKRVREDGGGSILRLHTANAAPIGCVSLPEEITAICFSNAPEGVSVNVIATGLNTGVIKLWSTWDLSPLNDIVHFPIRNSIIGLTYSNDNQHMYASVSDGNVYIWESVSSTDGSSKTPKFFNLTAII